MQHRSGDHFSCNDGENPEQLICRPTVHLFKCLVLSEFGSGVKTTKHHQVRLLLGIWLHTRVRFKSVIQKVVRFQTCAEYSLRLYFNAVFVLHSCRPLPPVQQTRREARQATFLFRRGLKVHDGYVWQSELFNVLYKYMTLNVLWVFCLNMLYCLFLSAHTPVFILHVYCFILQVQAQVQKPVPHAPPVRTRQ